MPRRVIGMDAGGSKLLAGVVAEDGEILFRTVRSWPEDRSREAVLACIAGVVEEARAQADRVEAVGCGIPATVEIATGYAAACAHLPLVEFGFGDWLADTTGLPAFVDNDATLAMLAEHRRGAARGTQEAVLLTIGTGIGGGLVTRGRLLRGASGAAGEPGHMTIDFDGPPCPGDCPGRGCLEAYVSGPALAEAARDFEIKPNAVLTGADVIDAALARHELAHRAIDEMGQKLGVGMANLMNLLEPEIIVLGGGVGVHAGPLLLDPAERVARERALEPAASQARMATAELGAEAGMLGAAILALEAGQV
jgi:glucokinase